MPVKRFAAIMTNCNSCRKEIKYTGESLTCNTCRAAFHYGCLNITSAKFNSRRKELQKSFNCPTCSYSVTRRRGEDTPIRGYPEPEREKSLGSVNDDSRENLQSNVNTACRSKKTVEDEPVSSPEINEVLSHPKRDSPTAMPSFDANALVPSQMMLQFQQMFMELTTNIKALSDSIGACREEMAGLRTEFTEIKGKIQRFESYETEIKELRDEMNDLRSQLNNRERMQVLNNIEIAGVNEHNGENLSQIVSNIAVKLGVDLDNKDVDYVARAGRRTRDANNTSGRPRSIIVRFTRRAPRNEILHAARTRRNLTTDQMDLPGTPTAIYINEHLIKFDRQLYGKARSFGREREFKYVWRKNGRILVRKTDGGTVYHIQSEDDLFRL